MVGLAPHCIYRRKAGLMSPGLASRTLAARRLRAARRVSKAAARVKQPRQQSSRASNAAHQRILPPSVFRMSVCRYATTGTVGPSGSSGTADITPTGSSQWIEPTRFEGSVGWSESQFWPLTAYANGSIGSSRAVYQLYEDFSGSPFVINQSLAPTNISWLSPMAMSTTINVQQVASYTYNHYTSADCTGPTSPASAFFSDYPTAPGAACTLPISGSYSLLSYHCDMSGTAPRWKAFLFQSSLDCNGTSVWLDNSA